MNVIQILNFLHRKGFQKLLTWIVVVAYRVKGYGLVRSTYHPIFRAYEYRVRGVTYMCPGAGWAYTHEYLTSLLRDNFCYYYFPSAGDIVFDIGAGLGEESVIFCKCVGKEGRVFAIEANERSFSALEYMCRRNEFEMMTPIQVAIYGEDGSVTIEDDDNYLKNTIHLRHERTGIQVPARSLDSLVREYAIKRIDFLKVNIEGAERFLIEGMSDSLSLIKHICISCHDFRHIQHNHGTFYVTRSLVENFLSTNGFIVTNRRTGNPVVDNYVYARNPSTL